MFDTLTRMGAAGAGGTYEIEKSVRFNNNADDSRFEWTPSGAGNTKVFTFSCWVKRTLLGVNNQYLIRTDTTFTDRINFDASDRLVLMCRDNNLLYTTRKFRDTSAWYHILVNTNTGNGTAGDRHQIWINGVRETAFDANNNLNDLTIAMNAAGDHHIGGDGSDGFGGYMAEVHLIDGQQIDASNFGETDPDTGQWIPKKYSGTYGTNGFYLDFKDNSGTTSTTLGKDSSGNGNNFTPQNFSVATDDEIACDSFSDTPTNNWCTMNVNNNPNGATINNGGLEVNLAYPHGDNGVYASFGVTSGKWYWEAKCTSAGNRGQVGVTDAGHKSGSNSGYNYSVATRHTGSTSDTSGTSNSNLDAVIDSGNWVTFCFDADNGQIWYSREAAPNISGTANVTGLTLGPGRSWQPHIRETGNPVSNFTFNFGASAAGFKYGPPNDDYKPLNAANLPEPTIKKPTDYFNTVLYTSNATNGKTVTGVGFSPDLFWAARRNASGASSQIYDTVRGVGKGLDVAYANDTEVADGVTSFDSDGVTLGATWPNASNGDSWVAWSWKESASAGFDMFGYTGTGNNPQTRAHSLGVVPEMIIVKSLDSGETDQHWVVYHHNSNTTPEDYFGRLNTSDAFEDLEMWNDTAPTSSVFTTQNHAITNANGSTFIAYLWASVEGYSKVGSYRGNNSSDGPFIYTGFKPAWFMVKNIANGESWEVYDNARDPHNVITSRLQVDTNNGEVTSTFFDFLSNGIKIRNTSGGYNNNGGTFIYLAFAESPFKYANAK